MTACGDEHRHLLSEISYGLGGVLDYSILIVLLRCQCSKTWRLGCWMKRLLLRYGLVVVSHPETGVS